MSVDLLCACRAAPMLELAAVGSLEHLRQPQAPNSGLLSARRVLTQSGDEHRMIAIHLAECEGLRSQANVLVNRMYEWRGYGANHQLSNGENSVIFTASLESEVVGTLSLTVDTDEGLSTDHTFKAELDEFRKISGTRLCELTKFAVDPATKSPPALAALFHVIFIYGTQRFDCTDLFIEVHPRHIRFYEAMLGFERISDPKIDRSVTWWPDEAPVQLMRLEVAEIGRQIDRYAGRIREHSRSLYPYFFSSEEARGIAERIARLDGAKVDPAGTLPC